MENWAWRHWQGQDSRHGTGVWHGSASESDGNGIRKRLGGVGQQLDGVDECQ